MEFGLLDVNGDTLVAADLKLTFSKTGTITDKNGHSIPFTVTNGTHNLPSTYALEFKYTWNEEGVYEPFTIAVNIDLDDYKTLANGRCTGKIDYTSTWVNAFDPNASYNNYPNISGPSGSIDFDMFFYGPEYESLSILGIGVIVFGFWGIIKIAAELFLGIDVFNPEDVKELNELGIMIVHITLYVVLTVDIILRIIVGIKAKREEHGRKTGRGYLVIILWLVLSSSVNVTAAAWEIITMRAAFFEYFVAIFMELSSLVVSLEVFIAAVSVRRYRRKHLVGRSR